jgi:hypothetical protein
MIKYNLYKQLLGKCLLTILHSLTVISWCIDQWLFAENENSAKGID